MKRARKKNGRLATILLGACLVGCGGDSSNARADAAGISADYDILLNGSAISLPVVKSCSDGSYGASFRAQEHPGDDTPGRTLLWTGSPPDEDGLKAVITLKDKNGSYMASGGVERDGDWFVWNGEFTFLEKTDAGTKKTGTAAGSVKFKCNS